MLETNLRDLLWPPELCLTRFTDELSASTEGDSVPCGREPGCKTLSLFVTGKCRLRWKLINCPKLVFIEHCWALNYLNGSVLNQTSEAVWGIWVDAPVIFEVVLFLCSGNPIRLLWTVVFRQPRAARNIELRLRNICRRWWR